MTSPGSPGRLLLAARPSLAPFMLLLAAIAGCRTDRGGPERGPPPGASPAPLATPSPPPTDSAGASKVPPPLPVADGPRWATWPMPSAPAAALPNPARYQMRPEGVVIDEVTGLIWQQDVDGKSFTWPEARQYCAGLDVGGHHDWRLPSRIELVSIVDLTHSQPSIDQHAFPHAPVDWFWTSSLDASNPKAAWYVYFYFGYPKTDPIETPYRARCVRTPPPTRTSPASASAKGPAPPAGDPAYVVQKEVVRDLGTGLTWQRGAPDQTFSFDGAKQYCARLHLGGRRAAGWRVPTMGELLTLVDERTSNPTIDSRSFPKTANESYWTSVLFADTPKMAWHVYFDYGNALYGLLKGPYRVRCVH